MVGANDSFLFFTNDSEHDDGEVSYYTWSMEYVKTIGQLREIKMKYEGNFFLLNNDKRCLTYNLEYNQLYFLNKYDENTHEVVWELKKNFYKSKLFLH